MFMVLIPWYGMLLWKFVYYIEELVSQALAVQKNSEQNTRNWNLHESANFFRSKNYNGERLFLLWNVIKPVKLINEVQVICILHIISPQPLGVS